jgi:hypothetical protein
MTDPANRAKWLPPTLAAAVDDDPFSTVAADETAELELDAIAERERVLAELHEEDDDERWWWR